MKILPKHEIDDIRRNYEYHWAIAMMIPEQMDKFLSFIERHKKYKLSYAQAFFSPNGFAVYKNNDEIRIFCLPTELFELAPLGGKDAEGDWKEWLKTATLVEELK